MSPPPRDNCVYSAPLSAVLRLECRELYTRSVTGGNDAGLPHTYAPCSNHVARRKRRDGGDVQKAARSSGGETGEEYALMAARHDLDLPGGQILRGLYLPAPLERGDRVHVEGETYEVEQALTITDELHGAVVRARLKLAEQR